MTVVRFGTDVLEHNPNSVVTVGTFDGVHCGHRGIIQRMRETTAPSQSRLVVVTFDPHPQIVLQKEGRKPVHLLSTIEERLDVFSMLGVDLTVVIPFTKEFSVTAPDEFVRTVLVDGIGMRMVFVGHDHMFGKDRSGDETVLKRLGDELNFTVEHIAPLECDGIVVSSTKVREALYACQVEEATAMLGRPYQVSGTVVHGDGRGTTLGVPTANIQLANPHKLLPGNGIYIVTCVVGGREVNGVASIGVRPTFEQDGETLLEVHLLDAREDVYDREVTVHFHRYLRPELRFDSAELLITQMQLDIQQAQTFFQTHFIRTTS